MYADEYKQFSGGGNQFANMLRMSPSPPGYKKPVSMPKQTKSFNFNNIANKLPNPATMINIAVIAAIGLGGYTVYKKFFGQNALDQAQNKAVDTIDKDNAAGVTAKANTYVSTDQATVNEMNATRTSLTTAGYQVSSLHQGIANQLHAWMDTFWVNDDEIVKAITGMSQQTFQLVSVAYGTRDMKTWYDWHSIDWFSHDNTTPYNLKDSLIKALSSSELTTIHDWMSSI